MLYDYFKTNPGVKDLPGPGIEPQPPSPQSDAGHGDPMQDPMKELTVTLGCV